MSNRLDIVQGNIYSTGHLITSDVHNGGSVLASIYFLTLDFRNLNRIVLYPTVVHHNGLDQWLELINNYNFQGVLTEEEKHLALKMKNERNGAFCRAYVDTLSDDLIFGEFCSSNEKSCRSFVFRKHDALDTNNMHAQS